MLPSTGGYRPAALLLTLSVLICTLSTTVAHHDLGEDEFNPVRFHDDHGAHMVDALNLTGTSSIPLRNASWSLVNLTDSSPTELMSGQHLTSVQPVADGEFQWSLEVEATGLQCTCMVEILVDEPDGPQQSWRLVVYFGTEGHRPVMLSEPAIASVQTPDAPEDIAEHSTLLTTSTIVHQKVVLPPASASIISVAGSICEAPNGVCLDEPKPIQLPFSSTPSGLNISLQPDVLGVVQGVWKLEILATDDLLRSTMAAAVTVLHDTDAPDVVLSMNAVVNEREAFHVHAVVDDGYIGSRANLTWAIVDENGIRRGPADGERLAEDHLVLNLSEQGTYTVVVSARDLAGHITENSSTITVLNLRPTAKISVDGLIVSDGSTLTLPHGEAWFINASDSTDNEPVDYLWVVDEDRSLRGRSVLTADELDGPGVYTVELIVFDDDGSTHSSVIQVRIEGQQVTDTASLSTSHFVLLALAVLGILGAIRFRKPPTADLPKWTDSGEVQNRGETVVSAEQDATIEEDEARG